MILPLLMKICRFNFGTFETDEFKKFLRMGCIFAMIIGSYWTLRILKDSIFIQLVNKYHLPYAKTASLIVLLPLVIFYSKLLEKTSRERMLMLLPAFYGLFTLIFSVFIYFLQAPAAEIATRTSGLLLLTRILGYIWYVFVESFGSLVVALFWAFSSDSTDPTSAKRGFPLIVAIGQIGGIVLPFTFGGLPHRLGLSTDTLTMVILGSIILSIIPFIRYFLRVTPPHLLRSFDLENNTENTINKADKIEEKEPGFLDGLKLILSNNYLIAIFFVNFIYEFIITIFDFNFKVEAATAFHGVALSKYLSLYASSVNSISLLCLLLGISNITRFLGIGFALAAMPCIVGLALFGFLTISNLNFLFALMVGSKAINYALNGPALKQLYIPTSKDARFKAQAWIETFGSRTSKQVGSGFNMLLEPMQKGFGAVLGKAHYLSLSGFIGFPLLFVWFGIAVFLSRTFNKAIKEDKVVC